MQSPSSSLFEWDLQSKHWTRQIFQFLHLFGKLLLWLGGSTPTIERIFMHWGAPFLWATSSPPHMSMASHPPIQPSQTAGPMAGIVDHEKSQWPFSFDHQIENRRLLGWLKYAKNRCKKVGYVKEEMNRRSKDKSKQVQPAWVFGRRKIEMEK